MRPLLFIVCILLIGLVPAITSATTPTLINYQGRLTNGAGNPVPDGSYSVVFTIYDAPIGGSTIWTETQSVTSTSGLFALLLGSVNPIPDSAFNGTTRYLGTRIEADQETLPRTMMVTVPYAFRVATVDGSSGGTISGGLSIGSGHTNAGYRGFVTGFENSVTDLSVVCGGLHNTASGARATIGGGEQNEADGVRTVIGGGFLNKLTGDAEYSTIGGGRKNLVSDEDYVTISGGYNNLSTGQGSTISGGQDNTVTSYGATVGGGIGNTAKSRATVSGGFHNYAGSQGAVVGGGENNYALGAFSVVAGGGDTLAADSNSAQGDYTAIGGGKRNLASGFCATIPGGAGNSTVGRFSFAAGRKSKALHDGSFAWADTTDAEFESTSENQFLIRASGGVGIGTAAPKGALDISSTTGALIVPRMTVAQRDAMTPQNGMIIYNLTANQFNFFENEAWVTK